MSVSHSDVSLRCPKMIWAVLCVRLAAATFVSDPEFVPSKETDEYYFQPGDFILGGLFSFHQGPRGATCSQNVSEEFLMWLETMLFAIQQVNRRTDVLPDLKLGFYIRDDCLDEEMAMWSALKIAQGNPVTGNLSMQLDGTGTGQIVGIVGPANSRRSIYAAKVGSLYHLPVMSIYGTSVELGDHNRFPYFLRAVPPDNYQVEVILDILLAFDWIYTALISSMDTYGINGGTELMTRAGSRGVCFAFSYHLSIRPSAAQLDELVSQIRELKELSVIVMFANFNVVLQVLEAVRESNIDRRIIWIGTDAWPHAYLTSHPVLAPVVAGSIMVRLYKADVPGLHDYISSKDSRFTEVSPWMQEWWDSHPGCTNLSQCPVNAEGNDVAIVHCVYAFAYALDAYVNTNCQGSSDCLIDRSILMDFLHNVSFDVGMGHFRFDADGEPTGRYLLKQIQYRNKGYAQVDIGEWDTTIYERHERLTLDRSKLKWEDGWDGPPSSVCAEHCGPGYIPVGLPSKCCMGCTPCLWEQIVNGTECLTCPERQTPSENRTVCVDIIPRGVNWEHPIVLTTVILAVLGLILVAVTVAGLLYYWDHVLIKACSRELSVVNILGVTLTFSTTFPLYATPTVVSCTVSEVMMSCSITMLFATSFLKANRIYRVFEAGQKTLKKPRLISPRYQLALALILIAIQVIISTVASVLNPTKPSVPPRSPWELYCPFTYNILVSSFYNLVLVLLCCYFAFKARKVPDNYNESRFISISVYSMVLVCLVAVPVYVTARETLLKVATWSFAFVFNGFLTLVFVYLRKLYSCRFRRPEGQQASLGDDSNHGAVNRTFSRGGEKLFTRTTTICPSVQI
ncbi:metabotropic glutamate receptor 4-like [Patiria miniata]|uniref:G-protein coupled receptors family 3 profile domain-containing protein n=1 Tax=Patiria miniata TaxID=46514 RepID=A0A914B536_PATMI|nr:metabotropic glutamate receptor 4-like [Patiria miniata]